MVKNNFIKGILDGAIEISIGTFISNYYAIIASIGYGKLISTYDVIQKLRNQGDMSCVVIVQMFKVAGIAIIIFGIINTIKQVYCYTVKSEKINNYNEVNICNYKNLSK